MIQPRRNPLVSYNRLAPIILASAFLVGALEGSTNFYVDPEWVGTKSGTQTHPFALLDRSAWQRINAALVSGDVTIYFSA